MSEYHKLIEEAYIKPIRSVVIVDDEFPTLDKFYGVDAQETLEQSIHRFQGSTLKEKEEKARDARERAGRIITACRRRGWIVDLYDGSGFRQDKDIKVAHHLHQSDLLILDYELEGHGKGGALAVKTISDLALLKHFNMVAVYTQETDIAKVQREICLGLISYDTSLEIEDDKLEEVEEFLTEWEINNTTALEVFEKDFDETDLIKYARTGEKPAFNHMAEWAKEKERCKSKVLPKMIVDYYLHMYQSRNRELLSDKQMPLFRRHLAGDKNWIRANTFYVTILKKRAVAEDDVIQRFIESLYHWNPEPHRLVLARLRHELDEHGGIVEDSLLENSFIQEGWYREIIGEEAGDSRSQKLKEMLGKQWENMRMNLPGDTIEFARRVFDSEDRHSDLNKRINDLFPDNQYENVLAHINSYMSCLSSPKGPHLTPGHVLKFINSYWLCATPACDLVPRVEEGKKGWAKKLGPYMPFKAVQLYPCDRNMALNSSTSNEFLFLPLISRKTRKSKATEIQVQAFSFRPLPPITAENGSKRYTALPSPRWEQFFIEDDGQFGQDKKVKGFKTEFKGTLQLIECEAEIVAQLRYEYALHIIQQLGANLMRIGLDFVSELKL